MIRTIWTVVTTLALANLLAIAGFGLWLGVSGRLSEDRVERLRVMFQDTVAEEGERLEAEAEEAKQAEAALLDAANAKLPPISAEDRLALAAESRADATDARGHAPHAREGAGRS